MKILSAKDNDGNDLTQEQIKVDLKELQKQHEKARTGEPMWTFFGGVLTVNGHDYQVV